MKSVEEYHDSMKRMKFKAFILGERVENTSEHPLVIPARNTVAETYAAADDPECRSLMVTRSHLSGQEINRFTNIHQSTDDLVNKIKMQRMLGQRTGTCFQRCVGMDAINALSSVTYEMDQELGTEYNQRFLNFTSCLQENDHVAVGAMTDPKGDRSKRPHQQANPNVFLRITERRSDGIVVSGSKLHQTGALNSHEIIVMPTMSMTEDDRDFAVSFALPSDAKGITYILGRQPSDSRRAEQGTMDRGNYRMGGQEAFVVFEDAFVPWERVFMAGEFQFTGQLVERFAGYHRQSYGGCKVGVGDILIGAAATLMDYHGLAGASHLRDKLVEMVHLNETLYSCGLACSHEGCQMPSGTFQMDLLLANVCKLNVTRFPYEIARLAEDITGGLMVTMPGEQDLRNPEISKYMKDLLCGVESINTECRLRMLRLVENLTIGQGAVAYRTESMHGAGPPQAMRIMIARQADLERKKDLAKAIAGIGTEVVE